MALSLIREETPGIGMLILLDRNNRVKTENMGLL